MKNTLRQIFHSSKFVTGFVIFMVILVILLVYPLINPGNPLEMIGVGTFAKPGTYVSLYDALDTRIETLRLSDADDNRVAAALKAEDRVSMVTWLTKAGIDVAELDMEDTDALLDIWNANYSEDLTVSGLTKAQRVYYRNLNRSLKSLYSYKL